MELGSAEYYERYDSEFLLEILKRVDHHLKTLGPLDDLSSNLMRQLVSFRESRPNIVAVLEKREHEASENWHFERDCFDAWGQEMTDASWADDLAKHARATAGRDEAKTYMAQARMAWHQAQRNLDIALEAGR